MAFLQLKKAHHINEKLHLRLNMEPTDVKPETNRFGNEEYDISCLLLNEFGFNCAPVNGKAYKINKNQEFSLKCTHALYQVLAGSVKDEEILLIMRENDGRVRYEKTNEIEKINVIMASDAEHGEKFKKQNDSFGNLNYGYESVKHRDNNRNDEIKWGMCINNATKISISLLELKKIKPEEILSTLGQYTHDLMHLAYALPDWQKHFVEARMAELDEENSKKDDVDTDKKESTSDEQNPKDNSDLPF